MGGCGRCGGGGGGGGGGSGGGGGGGDTHTASDAKIQASRAIYTIRACNTWISDELARDKIIYSITVFLSIGRHEKVEP
jgi:hypothetical protein